MMTLPWRPSHKSPDSFGWTRRWWTGPRIDEICRCTLVCQKCNGHSFLTDISEMQPFVGLLSGESRPRLRILSQSLLIFTIFAIAIVVHVTLNDRPRSVVVLEDVIADEDDEFKSTNLTEVLLHKVEILTRKLKNATDTIKKLKAELAKCKKGGGSVDKEESSEKKEEDSEEDERYRQYLLDFNINDAAQRDAWPWLDKTLYYEKLGGGNGIQYSEADGAIDAGQAESFGVDKTLSNDDLDRSFSDGSYYGNT